MAQAEIGLGRRGKTSFFFEILISFENNNKEQQKKKWGSGRE